MVGDPLFDLARFSMEGTRALDSLLIGYGLELEPQHERTFAVYRIIRNVTALLYENRAGGDWFDAYRPRIRSDLNSLCA